MIGTKGNELAIEVRAIVIAAQKKIDKFSKRVRAQFDGIRKSQAGVSKETQNLNKNLDKTKKKIEQVPFAGYAMSIMFAGMALQSMSMSLYKWGTKAFQEISHSVEGTITNTDLLEGSMKYLGFTIGQALEPTIGLLIPIIDMISAWTEKNPELTKGLIVIGAVLGTLLFVGGSLKLAFDGFAGLLLKLGPAITVIKAAVVGLASAVGISVGAVIAIIVAILAVLVAMWVTNFAGMKDFVRETFGIIWATIKNVFKHIFGFIKEVFGLITAIMKGDWDDALEHIVNMARHVVALVLKVFAGLGAGLLNIFKFAWNMIIEVTSKGIDLVLWMLQGVAKAMDKILGTNMTDAVKSARNEIERAKNNLQFTYTTKDQVLDAFGGIDKLVGLDKKEEKTVVNNITNFNDPVFQVESKSVFDDIISGYGVSR